VREGPERVADERTPKNGIAGVAEVECNEADN
jgi:hypothetical protein